MDIPHLKHLLMILSMNLAALAVCSCSNLSDTTFDVSTNTCAKDIDNKFMVQLKEKEQQLEVYKKAYELEKARAVEATGTDEFKTEMAIAHKTIGALQMTFWNSFPSPHLYYHIKAPSGNGEYVYLYADNGGYLCSSTGDEHKGYFQFEKHLDGTFSIYSNSKAKYLHIQTSSCTSATSVMFRANEDNKSIVSLIFHDHQDKQLPGILVDIYSLENNCFLSPEINQQHRFAANSPKPSSNKFLIIAEGVE